MGNGLRVALCHAQIEHLGSLLKCKFASMFGVGPEILHFYKLPRDVTAARLCVNHIWSKGIALFVET